MAEQAKIIRCLFFIFLSALLDALAIKRALILFIPEIRPLRPG